jgi:hypothetical protein
MGVTNEANALWNQRIAVTRTLTNQQRGHSLLLRSAKAGVALSPASQEVPPGAG